MDKIFGPKCHRLFPKTKRVVGGGCSGTGFYPAVLGSGDEEYELQGIDVLAAAGSNVSRSCHLFIPEKKQHNL